MACFQAENRPSVHTVPSASPMTPESSPHGIAGGCAMSRSSVRRPIELIAGLLST